MIPQRLSGYNSVLGFCSVLLSLSYSAQVHVLVLVSVLEKFDNFFKACSIRLVDHTSD